MKTRPHGSRILSPAGRAGRAWLVHGAMVMALAALACSSSCTRTPARRPQAAPVPGIVHVRISPLLFHDLAAQARATHQALILGTEKSGASSRFPLAGRHHAVQVDALGPSRHGTNRGGASKAEHRMTPVWLTTSPAHARRASSRDAADEPGAGTSEPAPGDTGPTWSPAWRSAVWMAAHVAATTLNQDLVDLHITADAGQTVDGAPASALLAAGFLASLTGHEINPDATALGFVYMDGTIGPLAGDPMRELTHAAQAGKTRVGHARGPGRMAVGPDGQTLAARARSLGVELVALGDVRDAYRLLTGRELPAPRPVSPADMALHDTELRGMEAMYLSRRAIVAGQWARIVELADAGKRWPMLETLAQKARHEATAAEALWQQKSLFLACERMTRAAYLAVAASTASELVELVRAGDIPGARARLQALLSSPDTGRDALAAAAGQTPATLAQHMRVMAAFQAALRSMAVRELAGRELGAIGTYLAELEAHAGQGHGAAPGKPESPDTLDTLDEIDEIDEIDELIGRLTPAILAWSRAETESRRAMDALAQSAPASPRHELDERAARRLTMSYGAVASANLAALEAWLTANETLASPGSQAQRAVLQSEPGLWATRAALGAAKDPEPLLPELARASTKGSLARRLLGLSSSALAYSESSMLLAAWCSLGIRPGPGSARVHPDHGGRIHASLLQGLLSRAERKAREHARSALVATGSVPLQARQHYLVARLLARSAASDDVADRLDALEHYWASSQSSQLAVALARN